MSLTVQLAMVAAVMLVLMLIAAVLYNGLMRLKNLKDEAWQGIDVQRKRRRDLLGDLLLCVGAGIGQEQSLIQELSNCLKNSEQAQSKAQKAQVEAQLSQALNQFQSILLQSAEYSAKSKILDLQQKLVDVEADLEKAKRYYNGCVREWNAKIASLPWLVVAQALQMQPAEYCEQAEGGRAMKPQQNI